MFLRTLLTLLAVALVGCAIPVTPPANTGSVDDYNRLVERYNHLLSLASAAHLQAEVEVLELEDLDRTLFAYAESAKAVSAAADELVRPGTTPAPDALVKQVQKMATLHQTALTKISTLEQKILGLWDKLSETAPILYQQGEAKQNELVAQKRRYERLGGVLTGIRNLLLQDNELSIAYAKTRAAEYARATGKPAPEISLIPKIVPTARDTEVASNVGSNLGFARSPNGTLIPLADAKSVADFARNNGYSVKAAEDGIALSSKTGGRLSFAKDANSLPSSISDTISHFKQQLNANAGALEIAFVIDYSGSMHDDIQGVIKGLLSIVKELENVKRTGRDVRIGIVTFGEPKKELVEQDLTNDMVKTAATLERLLSEYRTKNHSTDPGEASYHGMALAAKALSWKSENRMSIVITDEESYELRTGMTQFVDDTLASLAANRIQNRIYTLVVPQR